MSNSGQSGWNLVKTAVGKFPDVQLESEVEVGAGRPPRFDSGIWQGAQLALLRDQARQVNRHTFLCSGPPPKPTVAQV